MALQRSKAILGVAVATSLFASVGVLAQQNAGSLTGDTDSAAADALSAVDTPTDNPAADAASTDTDKLGGGWPWWPPGLWNDRAVLRLPDRFDGLCEGQHLRAYGPIGSSDRSHVAYVDFTAVDADGDRIRDDDAPWGRMMYFWIGSSFDFVFDAYDLPADSEWSLVHQVDTGDGASAICAGTGTADADGHLRVAADFDPASHLPVDLDPFDRPRWHDAADDALLTLMPATQADCETGAVQPPPEEGGTYLESDHGIRFVDIEVAGFACS